MDRPKKKPLEVNLELYCVESLEESQKDPGIPRKIFERIPGRNHGWRPKTHEGTLERITVIRLGRTPATIPETVWMKTLEGILKRCSCRGTFARNSEKTLKKLNLWKNPFRLSEKKSYKGALKIPEKFWINSSNAGGICEGISGEKSGRISVRIPEKFSGRIPGGIRNSNPEQVIEIERITAVSEF